MVLEVATARLQAVPPREHPRPLRHPRTVESSVRFEPARLLDQIAHLWQKTFLLRRRERYWSVQRGYPHNRAIEIVERFLVDDRGNLAGNAAGASILVQHDDLVRLVHSLNDSFS